MKRDSHLTGMYGLPPDMKPFKVIAIEGDYALVRAIGKANKATRLVPLADIAKTCAFYADPFDCMKCVPQQTRFDLIIEALNTEFGEKGN